MNTIKFTKSHDLTLSVKAGGHNHAEFAVCENGVMMDLSDMKYSNYNPKNNTMHVQPGCTFKEFDSEA